MNKYLIRELRNKSVWHGIYRGVTYEIKKCIDSFKTIVPEYKWHCSMVGGYWLPSEGILSEDEVNFISNDGIKYAEENWPENRNSWWYK